MFAVIVFHEATGRLHHVASVRAVGGWLNVLWMVVAGIWIFLSHVVLAAGLLVTLIGIPFAIQHFKLAVLALAPFGKEVDPP